MTRTELVCFPRGSIDAPSGLAVLTLGLAASMPPIAMVGFALTATGAMATIAPLALAVAAGRRPTGRRAAVMAAPID